MHKVHGSKFAGFELVNDTDGGQSVAYTSDDRKTSPNLTATLTTNMIANTLQSYKFLVGMLTESMIGGQIDRECHCKFNEFCGFDSTCHEFSCENIFQYAPNDFVGRKEFCWLGLHWAALFDCVEFLLNLDST